MPEGRQAYHEALGRLRAAVRRPADEVRRTLIGRAVGLLAGRVGCRLEEAQANLVRVAAEQGRDLEDVAASVIELLEVTATTGELVAAAAVDATLRSGPVVTSAEAFPPLVDALPTSVSPVDAVIADLRDQLAEAVDATAVALLTVEPDASLRLVARAGLPPDEPLRSLSGVAAASTGADPTTIAVPVAAADAVRTGRPVWRSCETGVASASGAGARAARSPWSAQAWLPLRDEDRVVALLGLLWREPHALDAATRRTVARVAAGARRRLRQMITTARPLALSGEGSVDVQRILDAVPGAVAVLAPVRDDSGRVVDFVIEAASPDSVDTVGRRGAQLVGVRMHEAYSNVDSGLWDAYTGVLKTGKAAQVGPITRDVQIDGAAHRASYSVRAHPLGDRLLISWLRHDVDASSADRIAQTERLGNLGWVEWDLTTGAVEWSDQVYRIYERDPVLGPMSIEEGEALGEPEDLPQRAAAADAFVRGAGIDLVARVRVNGRVKHLRTVADAVRDVTGRPLKIYGIVQDVTARETTLARLAEVERQLADQRRSLAAEHRLASQLQHIILPVPEAPIDLPGLRVALRYFPAEHLSRVGGDWYHAGTLPDGSILLAIGDVAGHGIPAATTMAQMRQSLRALAVTTTDPATLMAYLNRLMCELSGDAPATTATAVIARYDPRAALLTWAQAGHPAPLFTSGGETLPLARPAGPLLGVMPEAEFESAALPFKPGNVLLLYTDGLVEHRSLTLEDGLAQVIRSVDEAIASRPDQPLSALLDRLRRANPDDDTCILAARPIPSAPPTAGSDLHPSHHY